MNILEAYIKVYNQFIVVISGISGCKKTKVAREISKLLNIPFINQFEYYKSDYNKEITIKHKNNEIKIIDWDNPEAIDWDQFNNDVNNLKSKGLVISCSNVDPKFINFNINYQIHLSMSKKTCIEKRINFLEKKKGNDLYNDDYKLLENNMFKTKMYEYTFPNYDNIIKNMKINKFINTSDLTDEQIIDTIWDIIISYIQITMDNFNKSDYFYWSKNNSFT
ncbi:AAA domain protein [Hokovirus HKV1]|uniref:AAA domain protein n=1 Tax=Hokovirus HKV1 TaxID=1977638 RepID=A0A1V0SH03_9VIRU|nr:AAA domain protein [Hokovirus HKV1]